MRHSSLAPPGLPARTVVLGDQAVDYRLRRSPRSRGMRITIDPAAGVVVSVPPATRRGWSTPEPLVEAFLRERQAWLLQHLARLDRDRAEAAARGGARDGGLVPYRGELHRVRVVALAVGGRRSRVERTGSDDGDELVVLRARAERRSLERVLVDWFREQARSAIERAVDGHAAALGVRPTRIDLRDPTSRWGSASRRGRLMFSWRLVLAPPATLETVVVHELAHLRQFGHGPAFWSLVAARRPTHLVDRAWLRRNAHALRAALDVQPDALPAGIGPTA